MDDLKKITDFCMNQGSISTLIFNFMDQFMEWYEEEDEAEQKILAQCVLQMFRKYYYSALDPEMIYTPAKIVNTLCEREFGPDLIVIPRLTVVSRGKKISRLQYNFVTFKMDNHPLVKDMEVFLQTAWTGIRMEAPGIPSANEYRRFKQSSFICDRHYFNIIGLIALEAGYIECAKSGENFVAKQVSKAEEFFGLNDEGKLRILIETAVDLCSNMLRQSFPELEQEFTTEKVLGFLSEPEYFESAMASLFKKMGLNLKKLDQPLLMENLMETLEAAGLNEEKAVKLYWLQNMLDIYFFTPFGYYLQLIQPLYPDLYDLAMEFDMLLEDIDDFHKVRNKLFSPAIEYQLTAFGEKLFLKEKKPEPGRMLAANIGDEEMFQVVAASMDYLESEDGGPDFDEFDEEDSDDGDGEMEDNFQLTIEKPLNLPPKSKGAKIIQFPVKNKLEATDIKVEQVFVFRVKLFDAKRIWRQIEIKGSQTLHDLHKSILDSFGLDPEHLYAFFMSNKFWDKTTEYAHPAAESRSAAKIKVSDLHLNLRQKFAYIHDFGDENRFEVELTAIHEVEQKIKYPREIKRNKPIKTVCDECHSGQNPIVWYCNDHDSYLCDNCVRDGKHGECFIVNAIL